MLTISFLQTVGPLQDPPVQQPLAGRSPGLSPARLTGRTLLRRRNILDFHLYFTVRVLYCKWTYAGELQE
jgi:hypothetical protein